MTFLFNMFNGLITNKETALSDICRKSYEIAFEKHHSFMVKVAAKAAMSAAPKREKFFKSLFGNYFSTVR